ncbi:Aldo/keto reductase family protein [Natronorubrum thiooxidans]|uniref:Aldo/keto reductase family protein n=1 Tax=Natronorubrum thiooxidans TaxID=308853 RepID=A0A1N7EIQ1_9EURY|nr:Aldo/keto reductase family protein [Natronorubrum thiooxidans]
MDPNTTISTATVSAGGAEMPALGIGTARMTGADCRRAVETALEVGYRHIDTAQLYDNERAVGAAVAASEVARDDVFVVTKVHPDNAAFDAVLESTRESLERLQLSTVDLLLLHAPSEQVPLEETLDAMNDLQNEGAVDHIGVSNFGVDDLEAAHEHSETPIVANQVKYTPITIRTSCSSTVSTTESVSPRTARLRREPCRETSDSTRSGSHTGSRQHRSRCAGCSSSRPSRRFQRRRVADISKRTRPSSISNSRVTSWQLSPRSAMVARIGWRPRWGFIRSAVTIYRRDHRTVRGRTGNDVQQTVSVTAFGRVPEANSSRTDASKSQE